MATTNIIAANLDYLLRLADGYLKRTSSSQVLMCSLGIVVLSLLFQLLRFLHKKHSTDQPVPPGTFGLPLIGETPQFQRALRRNEAPEFLESRVKKYGEIFKTSIFGDPTVIMATPAGNRMALMNENKLVRVSWPRSVVDVVGSRSLLALTGEKAKKMRQALGSFLRPEALQKVTEKADMSVSKFLEECWEGKEQVLVFPLMKRFAFSMACEILMGQYQKQEQHMLGEQFITMLKGAFLLPINLPGTRYRKAISAASLVRKQLKRWLEERRRDLEEGKVDPDQDILTCLLCYKDDEGKPLSEQDMVDNIVITLFGGHDTTTVTMTMVCKMLAENPATLEDVWKEQKEIAAGKKPGEPLNWGDLQRMKLSWRVLQETLRLQPPLPGTFRVALKDIDFSGFRIPKSWKIYVSPNTTHANPKYFPDPHKFDPSRFEGTGPPPFTFLPFGGGARMCVGMEFAKMQGLLLLHNLVLRFKWKLVDPEERICIDPLPEPQKGLPIWLERREPD